jgi:serine protease Do
MDGDRMRRPQLVYFGAPLLRIVIVAAVAGSLLSAPAWAKDYLTINSSPPGATVEINGQRVGTTPYSVEVPDGYLRGTKTVFGKLLRQPLHVRVTLDGYLPKDEDLTNGPLQWIALNGVNHGNYWLLKTSTFNYVLDKAATTFTGKIDAAPNNATLVSMRPAPSVEDVVRQASPAVLYLEGSGGTGSGFLVSETGIAVTNAHVARNENEIVATAGNGQSFESKVVYVDAKLDVALLKLEGTGFPSLRLADTGSVQPGSSVIAIGTPSKGFQNSVTKGVVGGVGQISNEPGSWIQTDAAINPGNSGGPLLNSYGEVVGITTMKPFLSRDGRPLQGIGFALSSNDLLSVLRQFYPDISPDAPKKIELAGKGKVSIKSDLDGAEIYVDDKFVGNTPSTISLSAGTHKIEVKGPTGGTWQRELQVSDDSELSVKAVVPSK